MMTTRILLRGGLVADGVGATTLHADVLIDGQLISAVGNVSASPGECEVIDLAAGSVICPGFIDAHVHAEGPLLAAGRVDGALAQGVTTLVVGQDEESRLTQNVAVLASQGTIRHNVAGLAAGDRQCAGSDGIYQGQHPHPRGYGAFARLAEYYLADGPATGYQRLARHLSTNAADAYGLRTRGRLAPGMAADLCVIGPGGGAPARDAMVGSYVLFPGLPQRWEAVGAEWNLLAFGYITGARAADYARTR